MTQLRNIHVLAATCDQDAAAPALPRLRTVTNSPAMEYERRPGSVRAIGEDVAACIVARKRFVEVRRDEIKFDEAGVTYKFAAVDSITCRTREGQRVLVVFNGAELMNGGDGPSCIHVLTEDCAYVETLQRKGRATPFDAASSAREIANANRSMAASRKRLEVIHGKDIRQAADAAAQNAAEMRAAVTQLPAPAATRRADATAASTERSRGVSEALARGGPRKGDQGRDTTQFWATRSTAPEHVNA